MYKGEEKVNKLLDRLLVERNSQDKIKLERIDKVTFSKEFKEKTFLSSLHLKGEI